MDGRGNQMKKSRSVVNKIREKHNYQGNIINEMNQNFSQNTMENALPFTDKKTEAELKRSEVHYQFLNNLFQTIPCAIVHYSCSPIPKMKYCNRAAIAFCGFEDNAGYERLLGLGFNRFIPAEWTSYVNHLFVQAFEKADPIIFEYQMCKVDGSLFWIKGILQRIFSEEEGVLFQSIYIDVTKTKNVYSDKEKNVLQMDELVENVPAGIIIFEVTDRVRGLYANDGFCEMTGYKKEEYRDLMMEDALFCVYSDDVELVTTVLQRSMHQNKPIDLNFRMAQPNHEFRWVNVKAKIIEHNEEKVIYYAVFTDIANLNQTQEKLDQIKGHELTQDNLKAVLNSAKKVKEAKQEFFSLISQEIVAPLNEINERLELLEQQEHLFGNECLESAKTSARDVTKLLSDILSIFQ